MRAPGLFNVAVFMTLASLKYISGEDTMTNSLQKRLALEVMKLMPQTSVVVSPLAIRFSLNKLTSVAEGDAKQELMSVLGYKSIKVVTDYHTQLKEEVDSLRQYSLLFYNKIYVDFTDDVKPSFFTNSSDTFGVSIEKVGFKYPNSARSYINRWIETATYRRITDMLNDKDIDTATTMITISALHFKPVWELPFDIRMNDNKRFHFYNNTIISKVPMMSKTDHIDYLEHEGYKIFSLKLGSKGGFVVFVVPSSPQGLPDLIEKLYKEPDYIKKVLDKLDTQLFTLYIPIFKIKTYVDWTGFLQEIGLNAIFSESSGLNSILEANSTLKNIRLNKAKQKVFVEFEEMGPFRYTLSPLGAEKVPRNMIKEEVIDSPFYFTVNIQTDDKSLYELFNGVYYGPE